MDRAALLARLADLATTTGFGGDSLRDLAAASGASARMLVYYFHSREELLADVARELLGRWKNTLAEETQEPSPDARVALTRMWHTISARRNEGLVRSLIQLTASALSGKDGLEAFRGSAVEELRKVIAGLAGDRGSERTRAHAVTVAIWGGAMALVMTGDRTAANEGVLTALEKLLN